MLQLLSHFSHVQLFVTLWTIAHQASLYMGFSRQEYWNGLPFPFPGELPDPGIESKSLSLQADALLTELRRKPFIHSRIYMSIPVSQFIPPPLPLWCPYICSLHLCLWYSVLLMIFSTLVQSMTESNVDISSYI